MFGRYLSDRFRVTHETINIIVFFSGNFFGQISSWFQTFKNILVMKYLVVDVQAVSNVSKHHKYYEIVNWRKKYEILFILYTCEVFI